MRRSPRSRSFYDESPLQRPLAHQGRFCRLKDADSTLDWFSTQAQSSQTRRCPYPIRTRLHCAYQSFVVWLLIGAGDFKKTLRAAAFSTLHATQRGVHRITSEGIDIFL